MKFGIVVFPGSNCDRDMQFALESDLGSEVHMLWHKDEDLSMFSKEDCIVLPGGFSYGDYLRSGALARFSPMMEQVIRFAASGGKVLGVCNGFQVLCEAGLLPGALLKNEHQKFNCKNVFLKRTGKNTFMDAQVAPATVLKVPVAHGEGRYYADASTLKSLWDNQQVLFQYCDGAGNITPESNPNGAVDNIAGICNEAGNVIGMMPHPERASSVAIGNDDGKAILLAFS